MDIQKARRYLTGYLSKSAAGALVALAFGCGKPPAPVAHSSPADEISTGLTTTTTTTTANNTALPKIDASKLLTSEELQAVLGEPLKEAVESSRSEAGFAIAQCYFTLPTPSRSVVLTVTTKGDGPQPREPRQFWEEKFHEGSEEIERKEGKPEEEAEHPLPTPRKIEDVGEEAYWIESGQMGALYALEGNRFIRLAIGGNDDEETKIERSAALARTVLKRL